jgi:aspartate/methionine/tyrosine aminotransferase
MTTLSQQAFGLDKQLSIHHPLIKQYDLSIGEPNLSQFPFDVFASLQNIKKINCYYPAHGDLVLREKIINKYYPGHSVNNIGITHGTIGALDFIFRANLNNETEILIPDPGFPPYVKLAEFSGARIKKYFINLELNSDYCIDWNSLEVSITPRTKFILINSPHNPTGKVLTQSDYVRFQEILEKYEHVSFILDEVYRELIFGNKTHCDFSRFIDRGYVVGSFSKMYPLAGARIGWVLTSSEKMKLLAPYFNNATGSMSSFGQEIVKTILSRELSFQKIYSDAAADALKILDFYHVDYIVPEGAFFVFIKYIAPGALMAMELSKLGVDVVPGIAFGKSGENFIRVSFAQEKDILKNGFTIIAEHWNKIHARILQ